MPCHALKTNEPSDFFFFKQPALCRHLFYIYRVSRAAFGSAHIAQAPQPFRQEQELVVKSARFAQGRPFRAVVPVASDLI